MGQNDVIATPEDQAEAHETQQSIDRLRDGIPEMERRVIVEQALKQLRDHIEVLKLPKALEAVAATLILAILEDL